MPYPSNETGRGIRYGVTGPVSRIRFIQVSIDFEAVRQQHSLLDVAARYIDPRRRGKNYWAICPFHKDSKPTNFNIYRCKDGLYRYRCFACDEGGDVIDFVSTIEGCDTTEAVKRLTNNNLPEVGAYTPKDLPQSQTDAWNPIVPVPEYAPDYQPRYTVNPNTGKVKDYASMMERLDPYFGAGGELLFYVIRCRFPDGRKWTPVITYCEGPNGEKHWTAKRMKEPFPIMGLNELTENTNSKVIIVSGEKCKAALTPVFPEYVVITWLGGDAAVKQTDWSPLAGIESIMLWADADNPGNSAMNRISKIVDEIEKSGTG